MMKKYYAMRYVAKKFNKITLETGLCRIADEEGISEHILDNLENDDPNWMFYDIEFYDEYRKS